MGDPRKGRKQWHSPGHPYQKPRLETELVTVGRYGLRNKRELWKARTQLGKYRAQARALLALEAEERAEREQILLGKLTRLGIVTEGTPSDEILALEVEVILKRRLQTLVLEKGFAGTIHQARQLIAHRHIAINGRILTSPGYMVPVNEEDSISYSENSPFIAEDHPMKQSLSRDVGLIELPERRPKYERR
ncbi:MAG: 30S ribosomal protein S4 [Candidatus Heimdallarchaeota archaeon]|nr:30S ribosomal protein S4 [Candidatus Heimdallarchaeota archaeon]